ncbi:tetratricopeptide repeat protein, partial [Vibrio sp. DNB22_19_1]
GTMYLYGYGVPVDYVQAAYWYERSANQRNVCALSGLAYLYDAGLGVERDGARAVSLYQQALDGGMALAGYNLGGLYE